MDKQPNDQISIRINGREKKLDSSEELINEEEVKDEFPWVLPEQPKVIDFEVERKKRYNISPLSSRAEKKKEKGKKKASYRAPLSLPKKLLISIASALLVGTTFGIIVLKTFTTMDQEIGKTVTGSEGSSQSYITENMNNANNDIPIVSATSGNLIEIPAFAVYLVQGGVFSTSASAEQFAAEARGANIPAVVLPSDSYYLFLGVSSNENEIRQIGQTIKDQGQEIYVKPYTVSPIKVDQKIADYVLRGNSLYNKMVEISSASLINGVFTNKQVSNLQTQYNEWIKLKPNNITKTYEQYANEISSSYQKIISYQQTGNKTILQQTQQALLNAMVAYDQFVKEN